MKPRFISFLPGIAWFVFIGVLLVLPGKDIPKSEFLETIHFDKWVHTGLFAVLVFLFSYPFKESFLYKKRFPYLPIILLAVVYGIAMEYVQKYFTVDRSFDITDMIADAFGACLGYLLFRLLVIKLAEKISPCRNRGRNQN